jgi:hypothetical protein
MIKLTNAAKLFGVHPRMVFKWVQDKKITFFGLDPSWNICVPLIEIKQIMAELASSAARGEAIVTEARVRFTEPAVHEWEMTLAHLKRHGWSYGLTRYLDPGTGQEMCLVDASLGERRESGTGRTWGEAVMNLGWAIYGDHKPNEQ